MVRVRFAPSPTGLLHVGGLRTALYNYLFAKHLGGTFILRIEDTDQTRFVEGAKQNIIDMFKWAGIEFDEGPHVGGNFGPYHQSQRTELYRKHAEILIERGTAYYAFDTPEELNAMRERQQKSGIAPMYDRSSMRNQFTLGDEETKRLIDSGVSYAIRLFIPLIGETRTSDMVRGESVFANKTLDDNILLKSDGFPTYHLANIVDDHLMEITHVIRAEEWLPSLPKHIILYNAFGWEPPKFAHLPLLLSKERKKLSKRDGDVSVIDYKNNGFLPEALLNFVALLGWNPTADREIFTLDEMCQLFEMEKVNKAGAIFDIDKLNWMNGMYLRSLSIERLTTDLLPYLEENGFHNVDPIYAGKVMNLVKERINFVHDVPVFADYLFGDVKSFDSDYELKHWKEDTTNHVIELINRLDLVSEWSTQFIEEVVKKYAEELNITAGKLIHPLRIAITGKKLVLVCGKQWKFLEKY